MAFLVPQYSDEPFLVIEEWNCETTITAYADATLPAKTPRSLTFYTRGDHKWFARLSAPGYLDCTDWAGPFDSKEEAQNYIRDTYEVDPETGEALEDESSADQ
jgi:hypothetical protein